MLSANAPVAQIISRYPASLDSDAADDDKQSKQLNATGSDPLTFVDEAPPLIVEDRLMLSLTSAGKILITHTIVPGTREAGCFGPCCNAPDDCPQCAWICPCGFDYPEYTLRKMNASKYVRVRENSLEWNKPTLRLTHCCKRDLEVMDNVHVLYFDDSQFAEVKANARCCHNFRSFCCGGTGEPLDIEQTCCFGFFLRGRSNCCFFLPTFCPTESLSDGCCCYVPCQCWADGVARRVLWVEDANAAARIIKSARDHARSRMKI